MSKSPKEPSDKSKDAKVVKDDEVVDQLLSDLGVDDQMKHELLESGRMQTDVVKVESADQVRRRIEIEKASERQRDSLHLLERNIMTID